MQKVHARPDLRPSTFSTDARIRAAILVHGLRGLRAAEVEERVEQYVHDAYLAGLPWVRIIHGKGTGALRKVVRDVLSTHPAVERAETAKQNEGGDGATVAYLRGNA